MLLEDSAMLEYYNAAVVAIINSATANNSATFCAHGHCPFHKCMRMWEFNYRGVVQHWGCK